MSDFDYEKKIEIAEVGKEELFHGVFPTDAFEFTKPGDAAPTLTLKSTWDMVIGGDLTVSKRIQDKTGYLTPVGGIQMYGGSTAPDGFLLCNGAAVSRTTYADLFAIISTTFGVGDGSTTFNVPDFGGIFPRGAGTSTKLTNANSVAFAGTLGTYQDDKMQGHWHYIHDGTSSAASKFALLAGAAALGAGAITYSGLSLSVRNPLADGTNGTPRTGTETNPANLGINFIIKY